MSDTQTCFCNERTVLKKIQVNAFCSKTARCKHVTRYVDEAHDMCLYKYQIRLDNAKC